MNDVAGTARYGEVVLAAPTLDFRKPHPLRNEGEYDAAVAEIDALLDRNAAAGTEDDDRLAMLAILVEAYEE